MSDLAKMPAVHIPEQHQSSPKEHYADKAIKQAAEEIDAGRWVPDSGDEATQAGNNMGIALGLGSDRVALGSKPTLDDLQSTHEQNLTQQQLANHPRVLEALDKMRLEVNEIKGHELVEKNAALRELVMASEQKNRWDGQGRWIGGEAEEMRYGRILTPQQFYDQLGKVTGKGRLKLSEHIVFPADHKRSGLSGIYQKNPLWNGEAAKYNSDRKEQARKMADEAQLKWTQIKNLSKLGRTAEADKMTRDLAGFMAEAKTMYEDAVTSECLSEPELLRVATVQWPLMTEWMIVDFTEWGTIWKPKFYGWRTALLTMIRNKAITEAEAHKAFPVGEGPAAEWYLQQIFDFKNFDPQEPFFVN